MPLGNVTIVRPDGNTGSRIKQLRKARDLSQRNLSGDHCTYAYISRIEAGERTPSWTALIYLAGRLKTTALYLATGRMDRRCPVCQRGPGLSNKSF